MRDPTVPPCLRPCKAPSLVTSVTGGPGPAYCPRSSVGGSGVVGSFSRVQARSQPAARPLCAAKRDGFPVIASATQTLYHQNPRLSRGIPPFQKEGLRLLLGFP